MPVQPSFQEIFTAESIMLTWCEQFLSFFRKLARRQRQKDKAKKLREKEIEKRRRELIKEKEKRLEERRAEKEAARAEMDEEEEVKMLQRTLWIHFSRNCKVDNSTFCLCMNFICGFQTLIMSVIDLLNRLKKRLRRKKRKRKKTSRLSLPRSLRYFVCITSSVLLVYY